MCPIDEYTSPVFPADLRHSTTPRAYPPQLPAWPCHRSLENTTMDSAIISSIFGLVSTIIGAVIHQEYMSRKRLKEKLRRAEQDVLFLLEVERLHCAQNLKLRQASFKTRVRNEAFGRGYTWSGSFTPSRVRAAEVRRASALTTTVAAHLVVSARGSAFAAAASVRWIGTKTMAGLRRCMRYARGRTGHAKATT